MDFCPNCGKILQTEKNKKGQTILLCLKCGFKRDLETDEKVTLTEEIEHDLTREMTIVMNESEIDTTKPTKEMYCSKCENKQKISFWMVQTRSADESPTRFFRCTACGETWREYD
ncbi:MAG: transcription factor S [Candidatus Heimdallarchaeota archaeon]|nr:transcription factor S [Candidatus Heimdallarchaeota archaeon]